MLIVYKVLESGSPRWALGEATFIDPTVAPGEPGRRVPFPSLFEPPELDMSIILPAYNEEERMQMGVQVVMDYCEARERASKGSWTYEVIVVDDGSKDKTLDEALKVTEKFGTDKVRVLSLLENSGKGAAVRAGMLVGRGAKLLFADADGATNMDDLDKVEAGLDRVTDGRGLGIAVGSRAHLEEDALAKRNPFRNLLMLVFNTIVSTFAVKGVRDTQCGFKLFTRGAARLVFPSQHLTRWSFDPELLYMAQRNGVSIAEVPVRWEEIPGSKLRLFVNGARMVCDIMTIPFMFRFRLWTLPTVTPDVLRGVAPGWIAHEQDELDVEPVSPAKASTSAPRGTTPTRRPRAKTPGGGRRKKTQ